jgi:hypothetical protein
MKLEATCSFETLVDFQLTKGHCILEDMTVQNNCSENPSSRSNCAAVEIVPLVVSWLETNGRSSFGKQTWESKEEDDDDGDDG